VRVSSAATARVPRWPNVVRVGSFSSAAATDPPSWSREGFRLVSNPRNLWDGVGIVLLVLVVVVTVGLGCWCACCGRESHNV